MINLIPNEEKKKMVKAFYYRLAVLLLAVLGTCAFIAFVSILPAYFASVTKNKLAESKLQAEKSEEALLPDEGTLKVVDDLKEKLNLIENRNKDKFIVSKKVVNSVILKKMESIKIDHISYENDPVASRKVSIQGNAPSREVLLMFRLALEEDGSFKDIDLPISNFVKGSNIKFNLTLTPV